MNVEYDIRRNKQKYILNLIEKHKNLQELKSQCIESFGLVNNEIRKSVWPLILNIDDIPDKDLPDASLLQSHPSRRQVELDTTRMTSFFPPNITDEEERNRIDDVTRLIICVLIDNPSLNYYQGFHDICYIFYSVVGEMKSRVIINKLIPKYFSVFMQETMEGTMEFIELVYALLGYVNSSMLSDIEKTGIGPDFTISWIITWFAHVLPNTDDVCRIFDLFLGTNSLMLIYLSVSIILGSDHNVTTASHDFGLLYQTLLRLPKIHPVEDLIRKALQLYIDVPPDKLQQLGDERIQKRRDENSRSNTNSLKLKQTGAYNHRCVRMCLNVVKQKPMLVGFVGALILAFVGYIVQRKTS